MDSGTRELNGLEPFFANVIQNEMDTWFPDRLPLQFQRKQRSHSHRLPGQIPFALVAAAFALSAAALALRRSRRLGG